MSSIEPRNLLLRSFSEATRRAGLDASELVHLDLRDDIIVRDKPITFVDFPENGVMSILTPMENGSLVEIANIGKEGMVGVSVLMGVHDVSEVAFCQVQGSAYRIATEQFLALTKRFPEIAPLCQRYAMTLFDQVARNTGCIRTHTIEERCARWLLLTHDRCNADQFVLTQEFLALMLGVSRTGVNLAAGVLAKAGLIHYVRGKITILDRKGLESVSCDCYFAMNDYFSKIMNMSAHNN
jgi:CRP-like cAMP-binding protein